MLGSSALVRRCLACVCGLLAAAAFPRVWRVWIWLRPVILEPEGLGEELRALPDRWLSADERAALERDGVVLVRGLVPDEKLMQRLRPALRQHMGFNGAHFPKPWYYNGVVRALLRDTPLNQVVLSAIDWEQNAEDDRAWVLNEAPIWGADGEQGDLMAAGWHKDDPAIMMHSSQLSIWLAVSDAPHSLEFLRGSHRLAEEIFAECNQTAVVVHGECALRFAKERLDPLLGYRSWWWADLRPGDALLFSGRLIHRGMAWSRPRVALSARAALNFYSPSCMGDTIKVAERGEDKVSCIPYQLLPRHRDLWPKLLDYSEGFLPQVAAAATGVLFSQ